MGPMKKPGQVATDRARKLFLRHGGVLRTNDALRGGINPATLYAMRDAGVVTALTRGVYHLQEVPLTGSEDMVAVAHRIPRARICLISALAFHGITTQIPHEVYCAIPRDIHRPRLDYPPVRFFRFSRESYEDGVAYHRISGSRVAVYTVEKTLADCFKYRNQIGMDTVLEALKLYREKKRLNVSALLEHAKICRVREIMVPYLEATL